MMTQKRRKPAGGQAIQIKRYVATNGVAANETVAHQPPDFSTPATPSRKYIITLSVPRDEGGKVVLQAVLNVPLGVTQLQFEVPPEVLK
jgi:hypothetical protein